MTTKTETNLTIDDWLAQLAKESAAADISRARAQQEVDACVANMRAIAQRISGVQVASVSQDLGTLPSPAQIAGRR